MSKRKTSNWASDQLEAFTGIEKVNIKNLKKDFKKMPTFKKQS